MAKKTKKALGAAMAGVMAVGAVSGAISGATQVNVVNAATESQAVKNAKAKINHLIWSINNNYAGLKNQAQWEAYVKEAKALIAKIPAGEKAQADALTKQVAGISDTIMAIARINQVEKSYATNYKGIKNAAQWREYLDLATEDLKSVDKSVFAAKYEELVERLNKASDDVAAIEDAHFAEIEKIEAKLEKAEKAGDVDALKELLDVDMKKLGSHISTDELRDKIIDAIDAVNNKVVISTKVVNSTTVELTFKNEVKDINALKFSIEGLEVKNAAIKQESDEKDKKKVVILTTSTQEGGKDYTVKLGDSEVAKFKGVSAVIPEKVKVTTTSVQGIVGKEVTLKANIGQKTAGVPVTFNVDADNNSLNKDIVAEVYTDANGDASFTYTQYNGEATYDSVAVYATGNPSNRDFAKVYWGVDSQLTISSADDNKGTSLANGEKKVYKVVLKNGKDGKGIANRAVNVAFAENIGVTSDKMSTAKVHDPRTGKELTPYQLANGSTNAVTVTTDKDGVATFTVSGTNTKATPIVFIDNNNDKLDATELQASAEQLTFSGAQINNSIDIVAEGSSYAALGSNNGRVYTVTVKDKDGKAYAGGRVNLALNENLDKDMSTNTKAYFVSYKDKDGKESVGKLLPGLRDAQNQLELDKNGQAKFVVVSDTDKDYATPIIWIDQNVAENQQTGVLENGEPNKVGERTFFEKAVVKSSQLTIYKDGKEYNKTFDSRDTATFTYEALNQSGKVYTINKEVTFEVVNNGSEAIEVNYVDEGVRKTVPVAGYGRTTVKVKGLDSTVSVKTVNGNDASVTVSASGYQLEDGKQTYYLGNQVANAKFSKYATVEVATGSVSGVDTKAKTFYVTDAAGKSFFYKYEDQSFQEKGQKISEAEFEALIQRVGVRVSVTKDANGNLTFNILESKDITAPTITGVKDNSLVNTNVTPVSADKDIAKVSLTKNGEAVANYALGTAITEDGKYVLTVTDLSGNESKVSFEIDKTAPTVKTAVAIDENKDGKIDGIELTFSENVTGIDAANFSLSNDKFATKVDAKSVTVGADKKVATIKVENGAVGVDTLKVKYDGTVVADAAGNKLVSVEKDVNTDGINKIVEVEWLVKPSWKGITSTIDGKVDTTKVDSVKAVFNGVEKEVAINEDGTFSYDASSNDFGDKVVIKAFKGKDEVKSAEVVVLF